MKVGFLILAVLIFLLVSALTGMFHVFDAAKACAGIAFGLAVGFFALLWPPSAAP